MIESKMLEIARRRILTNILRAHPRPNSITSFPSFPSSSSSSSPKVMTKFDHYPMTLADRPAIRSLVPPGQCQFGPTFASVPLLDRVPCDGSGAGTSYLLRFGLPDESMPLGLTTCACVLACAELLSENNNEEEEGGGGGELFVDVIRPYTPISANHQNGCFDLLVKDYGDDGWLSRYMCRELPIGGTVRFKHIDFNVKIPAPFRQRKVGMIAGGTGITPMIQALHAILGDDGPDDDQSSRSDTDEVVLLYGSRNSDDVLGGEMLDNWANAHDGKFRRVDVLSHEPSDSNYPGERGYIDAEMIVRYLPPPSLGDDVIILVCGPPVMYDMLCGPRNESEVGGILGGLGYSSSQVFKF